MACGELQSSIESSWRDGDILCGEPLFFWPPPFGLTNHHCFLLLKRIKQRNVFNQISNRPNDEKRKRDNILDLNCRNSSLWLCDGLHTASRWVKAHGCFYDFPPVSKITPIFFFSKRTDGNILASDPLLLQVTYFCGQLINYCGLQFSFFCCLRCFLLWFFKFLVNIKGELSF